ncbi:FAD-binding protein [Salmonella enterica subsp. enterica]|uniref:FAD-binding protein n=1 Tax=Salmonella enterica I TaxID=59201 RepID=A0A379WV05_SALET|nr:FAD-binding protein [Salmonella enterica subsp. enterica]
MKTRRRQAASIRPSISPAWKTVNLSSIAFPKLNRFLTGYDLRHVFNDDMTRFDLTRILTGSEGTLAFITEARLDITPIPKVRRLVNVKYDSFDSALRNAPFMVDARALSVETVDSKVLNLAREDIVWHSR